MDSNRSTIALFIAALAIGSAACGGPDAGAGKTTAAGPEAQSASRHIRPCELLSEAEVKAVVPDLAGSTVTSNGESMMKNVEAYQCSHLNTDARGLIVIVHIAADATSFDQIKGSDSQFAKAQKLSLGDGGWLYSRDGELDITVHKGRAIIDLQLNTPDAANQEAALTALARTVVAKVN